MPIRWWRLGAALCALSLAAGAADPAKQLLAAARTGDAAQVRILLKAGASPDAKDKDGRTPLMLAAANGYVDAVRALLEKGANTSVRDKTGRTAFDWALFAPMAEKERNAILAALPQHPRFRVYVDAVWLADNLASSCFLSRAELRVFANNLHPDALVAGALVEYARNSGKDMVDIVRTDTHSQAGAPQTPAPPAPDVDGAVRLEVRPGASCAGRYDDLYLAIDVHVITPTSPGPILVKTFGGGLKGLHTQPVENPDQYLPFYEKWSQTHAESIYWAVVKALLRAQT
jgi:hypothetical protein